MKTSVSKCEAKDPKTCPYHRLIIEANEALQNGNIKRYMKLKDEIQKIETARMISQCANALKKGVNPQEIIAKVNNLPGMAPKPKTAPARKPSVRTRGSYTSEEIQAVVETLPRHYTTYVSSQEFMERLGYKGMSEEDATTWLELNKGIECRELPNGVWGFRANEAYKVARS